MAAACVGRTSCTLPATSDFFGGDPCINVVKSLSVVLDGCTPDSAPLPGATMVLQENGISAAAAFVAPVLQAALLQLTLPDQKFNEVLVDIHLNNIHVSQVSVGAAAAASADGLFVTLSLSAFHLEAAYQAWVMGISAGSGPCDIEMDATASVTVAVGVDCAGGPAACKPHLAAEGAQVNVANVSPVCKGVAGQVLDALVDLFKGAVKQSLTDAATAAIAEIIDTAGNAALAKASLDVPIEGGAVVLRFDLSAAAPPSAASGAFLALPVLGDAVVAANASARAPFPLPALPPGAPFAGCAASYLQLALSQFSLASVGWALWSVGALESVVPHTVIPPAFPIQLNTTDVGLLAPGLAKAFPNEWMQLGVTLAAPPAANLTAAAGVALGAPLRIDFQALPPSGGAAVTAFTLGCPLGLALQLGVRGGGAAQNVTGNVSAVACTLALVNTTVGPVDASGLALLVDFVLEDVLLPLANAALNVGFPLPSLDGLALEGTSIEYADGFAGLCTNFSYAPTGVPTQNAVEGS